MRAAFISILRSPSDVVIIPDPELFLPGSVAARLTGKSPVIDIHEDYGKAAMARPWVPTWARIIVRMLASLLIWLGRAAAWRVVVAAPELSRGNDSVVLNLPEPDSLPVTGYNGSKRLVYVGDVTEARGATAMVRILADLDDRFGLLLIGDCGSETAASIAATSRELGVSDRIEMTGRLSHREAWRLASGCLAGLSLLEPAPAYRRAVATKLWEYMSVGLPPIVSDLPGQRRLVIQIDPDLVCSSPDQAARVATNLASDPTRRSAAAEKGRRLLEGVWDKNRPDLAIQAVVEP
ncbi:MAG TPA: glycosyltransferase [Acidimicrobiia bacterium]|nr:glycosyltransferase [Acidimicrobiia bacterium]